MPVAYTVFLSRDAVQFFRTLRVTEREQVGRFLDWLEQFPSSKGDIFDRDAIGRRIEVKILGRVKVVYWSDHPVKEIKVLRISRV